MEIQVNITQVLDTQTINKKDGSTTQKAAFIGETLGQYPKKVKFDVMGDKLEQIMSPVVVGAQLAVSFDVESREWQGKWYTDLKVWRTQSLQQGQQAATQQQAHAPQATQTHDDDPF